MRFIKSLVAGMIATVTLYTLSCIPAFASYIRTGNIEIANCRTHSGLRANDKAFVTLKDVYIYVEGEEIYAGRIYGAEDYDIIGDDEVRCKVQSNLYYHYAVMTTDKGNSTSDDVKRSISAYTGWVVLAGGNSDKGWANFAAGFIVE